MHNSCAAGRLHSVQTSQSHGPVGSIQTLVPHVVALAACGGLAVRSYSDMGTAAAGHHLTAAASSRLNTVLWQDCHTGRKVPEKP